MEVPIIIVYFLNLLIFISCSYPPTGDEVMPGSVLLPASRRGRYLANIVRRQAVDGTGIKFNKDADRMNAEAKKKVDVLSDELLPYIIAEQERRTTLYKRIMTAIQNGEKGVTIAEIRNKPPLIIRKGLMYRCPSNRAPKEPDGSGSLMCDDEIEPTQVMYDSCLSAEDKDLFVADSKYFFCNRHKVEGPDLPRNGSTVIGCAPIERTSLNYTASKCALEDTDDVVVHYRYYPDRSYKFVSELDPDHEVCDHWNPCQIGYIYSLPGPDTAIPANELWRGYPELFSDYERDEIVPPIPEDAIEEFVHLSAVNYTASPRTIPVPAGYTFQKLWAKRTIDGYGWNPESNRWNVRAHVQKDEKHVKISLFFPETWSDFFYSNYYALFSKGGRRAGASIVKSVKFLIISPATAIIQPKTISVYLVQTVNETKIPYRCPRCHIQGIMIRSQDGQIRNVDSSKYRIKEYIENGKPKQYLDIEVGKVMPWDIGDFFVIVQNGDGAEERVKALTLEAPEEDTENVIRVPRKTASVRNGDSITFEVQVECDECVATDVVCNGESVAKDGSVLVAGQRIAFNILKYADTQSCVYLGIFTTKDQRRLTKIVAVLEGQEVIMENPPVIYPPPALGEPFEATVTFSTVEDRNLYNVSVNGIVLNEMASRRSGSPNTAHYTWLPDESMLIIRIPEFTTAYKGVYMGCFHLPSDTSVTKRLLEIGEPSEPETTTAVPTTAAPVETTANSANPVTTEEAVTKTTADPKNE